MIDLPATASAKKRRRRLALAAPALIVLVGAIVVHTATTDGFDAAVWRRQQGKIQGDNPRAAMVTSLERWHLHAGMTRAEVQQLLGEPDQRRGQSDVYYLGTSPVGVDEELYVIDYDADGKVSRFGVSRG